MRATIKKSLIVYLAFALIAIVAVASISFCTISQSALAEELPQIEVDNVSVHRGKTFEINVELTQNNGLIALMLNLRYNKEAFTLIEARQGDGLQSMSFSSTPIATHNGEGVNFLWDSVRAVTDVGVLLTLVFESNPNAQIADYELGLSFDPNNTNSEYLTPVAVNITGGNISLTAGEYSVRYLNADNTLLYEKDYNSNEMPEYPYDNPTMPEDSKYSYTFRRWKGVVSQQSNLIIYIADYDAIPQEYSIFAYVEGEYYSAKNVEYGAIFQLDYPTKVDYTFKGWFVDEEYTTKLNTNVMPDSDLRVYGFFVYNVREQYLPQISLSYVKTEGDIATVEMAVNSNSGLAYMMLSVQYDTDNFEFSSIDNGTAFEDFYFDYLLQGTKLTLIWDRLSSLTNNTQTGVVLNLNFKVKDLTKKGLYPISLVQDKLSDAVFFNNGFGMWYTALDITNTSIPIGTLNDWMKEIPNTSVDMKVHSNDEFPYNVELELVLITDKIRTDSNIFQRVVSDDTEMKDAYEYALVQQGKRITNPSEFTVSIKLTEEQQKDEKLKLFVIDDGVITEKEATIQGEYLTFTTNKMGSCILVGEKDVFDVNEEEKIDLIVVILIIVMIAELFVIIILAGRNVHLNNRKK